VGLLVVLLNLSLVRVRGENPHRLVAYPGDDQQDRHHRNLDYSARFHFNGSNGPMALGISVTISSVFTASAIT
jgi:hypothetical protein